MVCAEHDSRAGTPRSISDMCVHIEEEVMKLRPRKLQLQQHVRDAIEASRSTMLRTCTLELVGSVSWGGEVPQSDLDLMLCSKDTGNDRNTAIFLLQELCSALEELAERVGFEWKRLEFLDTARIPILCVEDAEDCRCDIGVDQWQTLAHREFLKEALESSPHIQDLIRLVKFWVRQRGLPLASEGGLPSLAWVFAALCLSDGQPVGTSLEVLVMHFFSEMCKLNSHRLQVLPCSAHSWRTFWQQFDKPNPWHDDFIHIFQVMDPSNQASQSQSVTDITPHRLPTALASLYVAELRMAWSAIRDGQWHKLWDEASPEVSASLRTALIPCQSQGAPIHVVLKKGVMIAGTVEEQGSQGKLSAKDLQRRDQSSQLHLQPCKVDQNGYCRLGERKITCHPCQWICALPTSELPTFQGDALLRIAEIGHMFGSTQTSPGLHNIITAMKPNIEYFVPMQMPMQAYWVWMPVCPGSTRRGQNVQMSEANRGYQHAYALSSSPWGQVGSTLRATVEQLGDHESEESTRASDNESHSSTRSLQVAQGRGKHGCTRNITDGFTFGTRSSVTAPRSTKPNKKNQKQSPHGVQSCGEVQK